MRLMEIARVIRSGGDSLYFFTFFYQHPSLRILNYIPTIINNTTTTTFFLNNIFFYKSASFLIIQFIIFSQTLIEYNIDKHFLIYAKNHMCVQMSKIILKNKIHSILCSHYLCATTAHTILDTTNKLKLGKHKHMLVYQWTRLC